MDSADRERPVLLVVDDHQHILDSVSICVSDVFQVETALDGKSGLAAVKAVRPELALVDLSLPDISGFALIRLILDESPGTTVVAFSGVCLSDLHPEILRSLENASPVNNLRAMLDEDKRRLAEGCLARANGNTSVAAKLAGMTHFSFNRMCARLKLDLPAQGEEQEGSE